MGWTLHTIMCVLLSYSVSVSVHMLQLLLTGRPISTWSFLFLNFHIFLINSPHSFLFIKAVMELTYHNFIVSFLIYEIIYIQDTCLLCDLVVSQMYEVVLTKYLVIYMSYYIVYTSYKLVHMS